MNKKPYNHTKDFSFTPPTVVRTSRVRVTARNIALIREFFSSLMGKYSARETTCFVRIEAADGKVVRESKSVSANTFGIAVGSMFQYIHTIGVSVRIIVNENIDGGVSQSVYTISG